MNMKKDIGSYLRDNRPRVAENPTFLLEVQQKLHAVDGIRKEVDRQRKYGNTVLLVALAVGLLFGAFAMLLAYLYPTDAERMLNLAMTEPVEIAGLLEMFRACIEPFKEYLVIPVVVCVLGLGVLLSCRTQKNR